MANERIGPGDLIKSLPNGLTCQLCYRDEFMIRSLAKADGQPMYHVTFLCLGCKAVMSWSNYSMETLYNLFNERFQRL